MRGHFNPPRVSDSSVRKHFCPSSSTNALSNAMLGSRAIPFIYVIHTKGGAEYANGIVIASGSRLQGLGLQECREGRVVICRLGVYNGVANKLQILPMCVVAFSLTNIWRGRHSITAQRVCCTLRTLLRKHVPLPLGKPLSP